MAYMHRDHVKHFVHGDNLSMLGLRRISTAQVTHPQPAFRPSLHILALPKKFMLVNEGLIALVRIIVRHGTFLYFQRRGVWQHNQHAGRA